MSCVTPPPFGPPSPPRPFAGRPRTRLDGLRERAARLQRDIAFSWSLPLLLIVVVLGEQALTLLAVRLDGAVLATATHVLAPLSSAFSALFVLVLVTPVRALHHEAMHDPLTGVLNRTGFEHRLQSAAGRRSHGVRRARWVMIAFDLDGFKSVNDRYGHAVGDGVLREIGRRLRTGAPRGALTGRLGGDEFVLAFRLDRDLSATAAAEALRLSLVAGPVVVDGVAHRVGATAGVAVREPGEPPEALMVRADLALVAGKLRGKNRSYPACSSASLAERPCRVAEGAGPVPGVDDDGSCVGRRPGTQRVT